MRKQDISTAKNYLTEDELDTLNRLVVIFLESAELRAKNRMVITTSFWKENVDRILTSNDQRILRGQGVVSNLQMEKKVAEVYKRFDARRKAQEAIEADQQDLEDLEKQLKNRKKNK